MAEEYKFKRTGAQIETLLDKIPAEGVVAKVYNTTLDLFGIEDGSVVTEEQSTEIFNIMNKWNQGYIVTYVDTRQSSFHYGVLNVCRCDDGVPTTLSVINDRGDLLAYSFEPGGEETWTVTNKTSGGAVYQTTLDFKSIDDGSEITGEQAFEINNIISKFRSGYNIVYTIDNQDGLDLIPRGNVLISIREDDYVIVFTIISAEEPRTIYYQVEGGGSEGGNWTVTNKTSGDGDLKMYSTFLTPWYISDYLSIDLDSSVPSKVSDEVKKIARKLTEGYVIVGKNYAEDPSGMILTSTLDIAFSFNADVDDFDNISMTIGRTDMANQIIESISLIPDGTKGFIYSSYYQFPFSNLSNIGLTQELVYKSGSNGSFEFSWKGGVLDDRLKAVPVRISGFFVILNNTYSYLFSPQFIDTITDDKSIVFQCVSSYGVKALSLTVNVSKTGMAIRMQGEAVNASLSVLTTFTITKVLI